ncbi:hypothetical protein PG991_009242 [Apiospora marii]|uniref:Uncharacterized protein n=1 Tax=Apiospora marii TaxID=335849 RepID=A0ABR1RK50_9PEZI
MESAVDELDERLGPTFTMLIPKFFGKDAEKFLFPLGQFLKRVEEGLLKLQAVWRTRLPDKVASQGGVVVFPLPLTQPLTHVRGDVRLYALLDRRWAPIHQHHRRDTQILQQSPEQALVITIASAIAHRPFTSGGLQSPLLAQVQENLQGIAVASYEVAAPFNPSVSQSHRFAWQDTGSRGLGQVDIQWVRQEEPSRTTYPEKSASVQSCASRGADPALSLDPVDAVAQGMGDFEFIGLVEEDVAHCRPPTHRGYGKGKLALGGLLPERRGLSGQGHDHFQEGKEVQMAGRQGVLVLVTLLVSRSSCFLHSLDFFFERQLLHFNRHKLFLSACDQMLLDSLQKVYVLLMGRLTPNRRRLVVRATLRPQIYGLLELIIDLLYLVFRQKLNKIADNLSRSLETVEFKLGRGVQRCVYGVFKFFVLFVKQIPLLMRIERHDVR